MFVCFFAFVKEKRNLTKTFIASYKFHVLNKHSMIEKVIWRQKKKWKHIFTHKYSPMNSIAVHFLGFWLNWCSKSLCWHICLNLSPSQLNTDKKIQGSSLDPLMRYDASGFIFAPWLATRWKMNIPLSVCCGVQRRCRVWAHQSCWTLEEEEEEEQNILLQHPVQQTTERVSYLMKSKSSSFPVCRARWSDRSSANDQSSTQV